MEGTGHQQNLSQRLSAEHYRPKFHFTPQKNWINDPNGLIYHNGKYHLFFQYNPYGDQWGNISWGHAVSEDLVHWEEWPVAIPVGEHMIFSGTVVIDEHNTAGFGENAMVAVYTSFEYERKNEELIAIAQHQSIAYSLDEGLMFQKYEGNPVLDIGSTEFRDPKVFWHQPTKKWVMLISLADQYKIAFYCSSNLIDWHETGEFGPLGNVDAVWECPDLFELAIEHEKTTRWVLTLSAGSPYPGFLGMQYFIGTFDGKTFQADAMDYPLYLDWGKDFYAGITYAGINHKKYALMIGWLSNHIYAKDMPTHPWRGAMSIPRKLLLKRQGKQLLLFQQADDNIYSHLKQEVPNFPKMINDSICHFPFPYSAFRLKLHLRHKDAEDFGLQFLCADHQKTTFGYINANKQCYFDRSDSGYTDLHEQFGKRISFPFTLDDEDLLEIELLVDQSVAELFLNGGEKVVTQRLFPLSSPTRFSIFATRGSIELLLVEASSYTEA